MSLLFFFLCAGKGESSPQLGCYSWVGLANFSAAKRGENEAFKMQHSKALGSKKKIF